MDKQFISLFDYYNQRGGVETPTLEDGKVVFYSKGVKHILPVAKTCSLKDYPSKYIDVSKLVVLITPKYRCIIDSDAARHTIAQEQFDKILANKLFEEKIRYIKGGYAELLIPLPDKVGQTNNCYLVRSSESKEIAISKKEYNALCRANTTIKSHFNTLKQKYIREINELDNLVEAGIVQP